MTTPPAGLRLVSTPVGRIFVDEADRGSVSQKLLSRGSYEGRWSRWAAASIRPGMHALDIGANIGYYTVLLAQAVGSEGSVVACEPDPHNCDLLRKTIAENGLENVHLVQAAVSDTVASATLFQDRDHHGVHSLALENCVGDSISRVEVATVTVDALMAADHPRFDFVKIDAQGAEAGILRGMTTLLAQPHAKVLIEVWPRGLAAFGGSVAAISEPFRRFGFESYTFHKKKEWGPIDQPGIEEWAATLKGWSCFNLAWIK